MTDSTPADRREQSGGSIHDNVQEYYGKILQKTSDLKSNACVPSAKPIPAYIRKALDDVHPDVTAKYYGCGLVVPECVEGCRMLDLGCGSGRDCYMLSRLVEENGHITGVDMTEDQLETARKYIGYHMQKFGYKKPNVNFVQGFIEALREAGLEEKSYDIIISNCVVNLSPDKARVLREAYEVLKDGGELYFSDVYSNARISECLRANKVLWGECLSGAMWWKDLMQLAEEVGFSTPRLVTASIITVDNEELERQLSDYKFVSATYRLFKLPKSSEKKHCLVMYNGNITGSEKKFEFDAQYTFKVNKEVEVDGDVANILKNSRFSEEFTFCSQASSACSTKPKVMPVDPFQLVELLGSAGVVLSTGGCCDTQQSSCGAQQSGCDAQESSCGAQQSGCGAQKSSCGAQKSSYGAQKSSCGAQKSSCDTQKSSCGAQKSSCDTQQSSCGAQKSSCGAQKSSCGAQKSSCGAHKSSCDAQESSCDAQESSCGAHKSSCGGAQESCCK